MSIFGGVKGGFGDSEHGLAVHPTERETYVKVYV